MTYWAYAMLFAALLIAGLPGYVFCQKNRLTTTTTTTESPETTITPNTNITTMTVADTDTTVPSTTPVVRLPDDTFPVRDGNTICILATINAMIYIKYPKLNAYEKAIPEDATPNGSCGDSPYITLSWPSFMFTMAFSKVKGNEKKWEISEFKLEFYPQEVFGNRKLEKAAVASSSNFFPRDFFVVPMNMSFVCNNAHEVPLTPSGNFNYNSSIVINSIKIQAFFAAEDSFGPEFPCGSPPIENEEEDESTTSNPNGTMTESSSSAPMMLVRPQRSDTVPIAVGSTLAVITILVVAAYAIYRSLTFKKVDYDNME